LTFLFFNHFIANKTIIAASAAAVVGVVSGYPVSFFLCTRRKKNQLIKSKNSLILLKQGYKHNIMIPLMRVSNRRIKKKVYVVSLGVKKKLTLLYLYTHIYIYIF
jgi:hypothetical protein